MSSSMWLSEDQVQGLKKYKYGGVDNSICRKLFLAKYWDHCIQYIPMWMAPNLVTLIGFATIIFAAFLLAGYLPNLTGNAPGLVYIFCGLAVQFYSLMDNLDGRQARRTGSSSALGELFDHGCDALNSGLTTLLMAGMLSLGPTWSTLMLAMALMVAFFGTTWEEYHTGVLFLGVVNGPDEGLLLLTILFIFTGVVGPAFWTQTLAELTGSVSMPAIQLNTLFLWAEITSCAMVLYWNFDAVVKSVAQKKQTAPEHKHRSDWSTALQQWKPMLVMVVCFFLLPLFDPSVLSSHVVLYLWIFTILFAFLVGRLIVCYLCDLVFDPDQQKPVYAVCVPVVNALIGSVFGTQLLSTFNMLWLTMIFVLMVYVSFVYEILVRFSTFLNIRILSLSRPPAPVAVETSKTDDGATSHVDLVSVSSDKA